MDKKMPRTMLRYATERFEEDKKKFYLQSNYLLLNNILIVLALKSLKLFVSPL